MMMRTTHSASPLRQQRIRHGWSQDELANRARISQALVSRIERGYAAPTAPVRERLARVVDVDPRELFPDLEPSGAPEPGPAGRSGRSGASRP